MNALTTIETGEALPTRRERPHVIDAIPVLDSGRFEQMQRIAAIMARSALVPDALRCTAVEDGNGASKRTEPLPFEEALANCFLVVNQAVRWGLDPFSVAQCCSIVRGKLMYEGKLVAAVLDAKLGVQLSFAWNDRQGDAFGILITGPDDANGNPRVVFGTVGEWKTTGANSPWTKQTAHRKMLAYRGTREWVRLYEPGILLGVYTPDEMEDMQEAARVTRSTPILQAPSGPPRQIARGPKAEAPMGPKAETPAVVETEATTAEPESEAGTDIEALVAQFERDSEHVQTTGDLQELSLLLQPYDLSDQLSRAQRNRIEVAVEAAESRIDKAETAARAEAERQADAAVATVHQVADRVGTKRAEGKPAEAKPAPAKPRANDQDQPAFKRGFEDALRGIKKCLKPEFRDDPELLALWGRGHAAGLAHLTEQGD